MSLFIRIRFTENKSFFYFLSEVIALVANEGAIPTSFDLMGIPRGITRTGKKERKPIR